MSFLEKSKLVRGLRRIYLGSNRIDLKTALAGLTATGLATGGVAVATEGTQILLSLAAGAATGALTTLAQDVKHRLKRHNTREYYLKDGEGTVFHALGKPADIMLLKRTMSIVDALAHKERHLPHLTEKTRDLIDAYIGDLATALPRLQLETEEGCKPLAKIVFSRWWTDSAGRYRTETVQILEKHPDDMAYDEAMKEAEKLAYAPAPAVRTVAPPLNREPLRLAAGQAVERYVIETEIEQAIKQPVTETANAAFDKAEKTQTPAPDDRPSANLRNAKRQP